MIYLNNNKINNETLGYNQLILIKIITSDFLSILYFFNQLKTIILLQIQVKVQERQTNHLSSR